jgi:mono/diheme cytochrome c family protein
VKHGIKMTGMPAWGKTHKEEDLWAIVAFTERLPNMSANEYRQWVPDASAHRGTARG